MPDPHERDAALQAEEWLCQGTAVSSGQLAKRIRDMPDVQEVRRLAVDMTLMLATPEHAAALQAEFPENLVLERNAALKLPG